MSIPKGMAVKSALLLPFLFAPIAHGLADELDPRLFGAWVPAGADCKQVFESRDGALTFRSPIDTFSTSFIVRPEEIQASTGSCRIGRISSAKDYITVSLSCENAGGFLPLNGRVKIVSNTQITYGDAANAALLDASYAKCSP